MASACLPFMFQAVEIDGEHYVDGALNKTLHASVALDEGVGALEVMDDGLLGGMGVESRLPAGLTASDGAMLRPLVLGARGSWVGFGSMTGGWLLRNTADAASQFTSKRNGKPPVLCEPQA